MKIEAITAAQDTYRILTPTELTEARQIAEANVAQIKLDVRDGIASRAELTEAKIDLMAVRGLLTQLEQNGAY